MKLFRNISALCDMESLLKGKPRFKKFQNSAGKKIVVDKQDDIWILGLGLRKHFFDAKKKNKYLVDKNFKSNRKGLINQRFLSFMLDRNGLLFIVSTMEPSE